MKKTMIILSLCSFTYVCVLIISFLLDDKYIYGKVVSSEKGNVEIKTHSNVKMLILLTNNNDDYSENDIVRISLEEPWTKSNPPQTVSGVYNISKYRFIHDILNILC